MSLLKPFNNNSVTKYSPEINSVLIEAGITSTKTETIQDIFERNNAGVEDAAREISNLMSRGETEPVRLRAAELALKIQGVFSEMDERQIPEININIVGNQGQTIVNLLMPKLN